MKKLILTGGICVSLLLILSGCGGAQSSSSSTKLVSSNDSLSYAIGSYLSENMRKQGIELNSDMLEQGYVDQTNKTGITSEESRKLIDKFQMEMMLKLRDPNAKDMPFSFSMDSISLAIGQDFSFQMETLGFDIDGMKFGEGSRDFISGNMVLDSLAVAGEMEKFTKIMQAKSKEQAAVEGKANREMGEAFLASNGKKEGVKTTASGLQYKVLTNGSGQKPAATDQVEVHYHGTLLDGTVFDSSVDRNKTATFGLNQVIPGWTEGLQLMGKGAKYRFWLPSNLAYGERGSGANIGPGATLVFDVELIDIK